MASNKQLVNFPLAGISLDLNVVLRQVIWLTPSKQEKLGNMLRSQLLRFNYSQQLTANFALFNMLFAAKLLQLASRESVGGR